MNKEEDYNIAERYRVVRKHLDGLGYRQALSLDALPLIEKLLTDLVQTTESLKHFKYVAQENIEACSQLQLVAEPYKCDNARLVQECNQLHLNLLETKEAQHKQIKDLKKQVQKLESECNDLQLASSRNLKKIKELEAESAGKTGKILELQGKCCKPVISNTSLAVKKRACYPLRRPTLESDPFPRTGSGSTTLPSSSNVDPNVVDLLGMADHRMNCLSREVTKLKGDLSQQTDNVYTLKTQLATKEKEILRLKKMMEGGRPFAAVSKDCTCIYNKKTDRGHAVDTNEIRLLQQAKQDLEHQLKESTSKQHEAMSRAMELAERNEELEKELRDIDHIALAVEADCNSAVQENNRRVCRLQEKLDDVMTQVHVLESELTVERRESQELRADLEACKLEKRNIQRVLESTLDEKKQMTDRINQLTVIEKDLIDEKEKLTKNCACQIKEISDLESSINVLRDQVPVVGGGGDDKPKEKESKGKREKQGEGKGKGEKNDKNKGKKILKKKLASKGLPRSLSPSKQKESTFPKDDEVTKDIYYGSVVNTENKTAENEQDATVQSLKQTIERLETEKDFFRNEYNKFREQFNMGPDKDKADLWTQACDLRRQLNDKEQALAELQRDKKELCREKFNLEARLHTSKSQQRRACISCSPCSPCRPVGPCTCQPPSPPPGGDATSSKVMLERLERERDTARADVDRLIEERDALRERLKMAAEAHTSEQRRLRESLNEADSRAKQLERERQDFLVNQGTRRATINGLEDQLEDMRQELRKTKEELTTQRTQYFQLRALQEQTDQALGDVQGQLGQSEVELTKAMDRNRSSEQQQLQLDNQVKELKSEVNVLRSNLAQLDQEKDQLLMTLDDRTERIAALEREVRFKEQQTVGMEQQIDDLQHKNQICVDQSAEQERQLRTMEVEIDSLQRQLANTSMDKENAIRENGRIQDDLAAVTCECRNLQRELEASRAESYDLKRQLQTYVTEVRRAEDLLNRKENERSEMLNHFRSLSLEATVLENNNQSLESEAAEARGALQTARDRLLDLERQLADRDCLIRGYETQIAELTQSVASMETQLRQQGEQRKRAEADLNAVRDLCVKLDQQKETLVQQLGDKESLKAQCEAQLARLKTEQNIVQEQMSRDHVAVDRLEALLAQARQEAMNNQATNQELQTEMCRLKQKICELQNKLAAETAELRRYQTQAAEYSKQISELRRQMTNERFERARKEEECRRKPETVLGDMKNEARRTNRFNTSHSYESTCSSLSNCPSSNNRITNESNAQDKEDEVACINIILKSGMGSKADETTNTLENRKTTRLLPDAIGNQRINKSETVKSVQSRTGYDAKSTYSQTDNKANSRSKASKSENSMNTEKNGKSTSKKTLTINSKETVWPHSMDSIRDPVPIHSSTKRDFGSPETPLNRSLTLKDASSSLDSLIRKPECGGLCDRINQTLKRPETPHRSPDLTLKDASSSPESRRRKSECGGVCERIDETLKRPETPLKGDVTLKDASSSLESLRRKPETPLQRGTTLKDASSTLESQAWMPETPLKRDLTLKDASSSLESLRRKPETPGTTLKDASSSLESRRRTPECGGVSERMKKTLRRPETPLRLDTTLKDASSSLGSLRLNPRSERLSERINQTLNEMENEPSSDARNLEARDISRQPLVKASGRSTPAIQNEWVNKSHKSSSPSASGRNAASQTHMLQSRTQRSDAVNVAVGSSSEKTTLASVFSNNTAIPMISIDTSASKEQETLRRNEKSGISDTYSQLCFCTGPNITPCGAKKPFTEEELDRISIYTRLNKTCCCSDSGMQCRRYNEHRKSRKAETKAGEAKSNGNKKDACCGSTRIEVEVPEFKLTQRQNYRTIDCCISSEDKRYTESEASKDWGKDRGTFAEARTGFHPTDVRTTDTRNICCGEDKAGSSHSTMANSRVQNSTLKHLGTLAASPQSRSLYANENIDSGAGTSGQGFAVRTVLRADAPRSDQGTSSSITASDFTRPEFVKMLTEIKEQTCNLEMQLASMNDTMKSKRGMMESVVGASLEQRRVPSQNERSYGSLTAQDYSLPRKPEVSKGPICSKYPSLGKPKGGARTMKYSSPPFYLQYDGATSPLAASSRLSINVSPCGRKDASFHEMRPLATSTFIEKPSGPVVSKTNATCCTESGGKDKAIVYRLAPPPSSRKKTMATQTLESTSAAPSKLIAISGGTTTPTIKRRAKRRTLFRTAKYKIHAPFSPKPSAHKISRHRMDKSSSPLAFVVTPSRSNSSVYIISSRKTIAGPSGGSIVSRASKKTTDLYKRLSSPRIKSGSRSPRYRSVSPKTIQRTVEDVGTCCEGISTESRVHSPASITTMALPHCSTQTYRDTKASVSPKIQDGHSLYKAEDRPRPFKLKPRMRGISPNLQSYSGSQGSSSRRSFQQKALNAEDTQTMLRGTRVSVSPRFQDGHSQVVEIGAKPFGLKPMLPGASPDRQSSMDPDTSSPRHPRPFSLKRMKLAPRRKRSSVSYVYEAKCCDATFQTDTDLQPQRSRGVQPKSFPGPAVDRDENVRYITARQDHQHRSELPDNLISKLLRNRSKQQITYTALTSEQNTPFMINSLPNKNESEKELNMMDYGVGSKHRSSGGKVKTNVKSKLGEGSFGGHSDRKLRLTQTEVNASKTLPAGAQDRPGSDSEDPQESGGYRSEPESPHAKSASILERSSDVSGNCSKTDSQQDPKCTIRVTLNLDDTPSSEELSDG